MLKRRNKIKEIAEDIKQSDNRSRRKTNVDFLSSGSTMVNLALSGTRNGGWPRGRVSNIVGDGSSGKTLLALEAIFWYLKNIQTVESKIFPDVEKFKVIYNNGEGVMDFPLEKMYGEKFEKSIDWRRSKTIESLGRDYLKESNSLKKGESLLYIVDSWDSYKSIHDSKIQEETDEEIIKGFNLKKQQFAWKFFAEACDLLENNNKDSTLLVISQTKQKLDARFGKKKYRTGGDALNFYTHLVPWIREVEKLSKTKKGEKRIYGIHSELKVERSKVALPFRSSQFIVLFDYGIDDISSMGLYLAEHKYKSWEDIPLVKSNINEFCKEVEKRELKEKLSKEVERIWKEVEQSFQEEIQQRKRKEL